MFQYCRVSRERAEIVDETRRHGDQSHIGQCTCRKDTTALGTAVRTVRTYFKHVKTESPRIPVMDRLLRHEYVMYACAKAQLSVGFG